MATLKDERIRPSEELRGIYERLAEALEVAEAMINVMVPKADRAEEMLNAELKEIVHEAGADDGPDNEAFMVASGYDDMVIALQGLCRSLHHFQPGCELP